VTASHYDFVIVGGGSAGCALANRLSADPANRVLVLEAGRNDAQWDVFIHKPAALAFPIGSRFYDWKYESAPDDPFRGHDGPLVLERGPARGPLFDAFFHAVQEAGYPLTEDVNGYRQEGFAAFDRNVHDGRRLSASRAYLHPVMDRPNLKVETFALVTRVLFENGRAVGVEYSRGGRGTRRAHGGEVVLC